MQSVLDEACRPDPEVVTRKLWLIWKHPTSRRYYKVGIFEARPEGGYTFRYAASVEDVPDFTPLTQFPDLDVQYQSDVLPAFLANRVMTPSRPNYEQYLSWLGLGETALPVEILARTGGPRVTDTFHLVEALEPRKGRTEGRFFVSGIRRKPGGDLATLWRDQELRIKADPDIELNEHALLLTADGTEIGWVPDWLLGEVRDLRASGDVHVFVDQVNPEAPSHLALLCRLEWQQST